MLYEYVNQIYTYIYIYIYIYIVFFSISLFCQLRVGINDDERNARGMSSALRIKNETGNGA